jgi:integrase
VRPQGDRRRSLRSRIAYPSGELLGHSSVAFTLQVYGHLLEETKKETASKMDSALSPVATTVVATKADFRKVN